MRSRDGNSHLLFRFCLISISSSLAIFASEYLVSYRYTIKDAVFFNETLEVSKAMKKCHGEPSLEYIEFLDTKESLKNLIIKNQDKFLEFAQLLSLHVNYSDETSNFQNSSLITLTLKTTCFKVDFNDNIVRIAPLK